MNYSISDLIISSFITAIVGLFSYATVKTYLLRSRYRHIPGPTTKGILGFFFGNVFQVAKTLKDKKLIDDFILEEFKKYGPVLKIQMANKIFVYTIDQKAIKEMTIDRDFPKPSSLYDTLAYPYGERHLGRGLVTETDKIRWKHRRNIFNPAFHRQVLSGFMDEFNYKSNKLLEKLRKLADGKTVVTLFDQFSCTALDIISHVAFGMDTDSLNDSNCKLNKSITDIAKGYQNYAWSEHMFYPRFFPSHIKSKSHTRKVIKQLRQMGYKQIMERIELLKADSYVPSDLLGITLKELDSENFDMEDMIDDFVTFFGAGQETTANTLAFCFIEIAKNPLVAKKLREEIDSVLGDRNEITNEDLAKLNYVSSVIKETLRLWAPAESPIREVDVDDFQINGLNIPKGSIVICNNYLNARIESNFSDPYSFNPERFMTKDNSITAYNYLPFSLGPRNCIGQNFAKIEMKMIVTKLVQNFDFRLKENQELGPIMYTTLRPIDGTQVYISPRISCENILI